MGTEVLRPQDCLIQRIRNPRPSVAAFSRRRSNFNDHNYNHNNYHVYTSVKPSRKPLGRPDPKKRVEKKPSSDDSNMVRNEGVVREKVMILRRGESLDSKIKSEALMKDLVLMGTERLGPDPNKIPGCNIYAGSAAFAMSPSPSALPLPSFHKKSSSSPAVIVDSATRDLRRLLGLE